MGIQQLGVGIIGAGIMGRSHAASLAMDPRTRLVGVAGLPLDSAQELVKGTHAYATDDFTRLLADPRISFVTVATPDNLHFDICRQALAAGKHVFVEKPLTTSLAEADQLIEEVERCGLTLMTSFNHRWIPSYAEAWKRIQAGNIGAPIMAYARKNDRIFVPTSMLSWASNTTCAWFLSSHDIDLVNWFFGETPVSVFATASSGVLTTQGIDTLDAVQAQVRYPSGGFATFESCWIYPDTFPTMTDSFIEVVGTDGVIQLPRVDDQVHLATRDSFSYPRTSIGSDVHGQQLGAVTAALHHMTSCVLGGHDPLISLRSSRDVIATLEAVHRSIASGNPEKVYQ
ncbi:Gfo/Idh/MocA family oxidoreductase [Tessaracoccus lubricantis]|uniref:Gfo/Idh/MocA family oxidoreductase n=1 Tax=Tessaracoccus lubricantis TaxID=545543 RepID=A0ABP9F3U2_9ACTN